MSGKYGRTELYTSRFPVFEQPSGTCTRCTMAYGMEMLGLLSGQNVVQLSPLYGMSNAGSGGLCAEHLWPRTLAYGSDQWLGGLSDYEQSVRAANTRPDAICDADAQNHVLLETDYFPGMYGGTIESIKAELDAGHPLMLYMPPNHVAICWDYDDTGVLGLDSRSPNPEPYHRDWPEAVGRMSIIYKRVQFSGTPAPHRINPYAPNHNVQIVTAMRGLCTSMGSVAAPLLARVNAITSITAAEIAALWAIVDPLRQPVQEVGKLAQMVNALVLDSAVIVTQPPPAAPTNAAIIFAIQNQLDAAQVQANTWRAGMVTQVQIDTLRTQLNAALAQANTLVADTGGTVTPPPPPPDPPPAGTSPAGTTIRPGIGTIVDAQGAVWRIGAAPKGQVFKNEVYQGVWWSSATWDGTRINPTIQP